MTARLAALILATAFSAAPAAAQTGFSALAPIDPSQPLQISADDAEVLLEEQTGTFFGNVVARQGGLVLTSERLTVFYLSDNRGTGGTAAAISKARAEGDVRIASAKETARGGWAEYDVAGRRIVLGGGVTLSRGENVLKGERLIIDIDSGKSRLEGGAQEGGRVQGLFVVPPREDG